MLDDLGEYDDVDRPRRDWQELTVQLSETARDTGALTVPMESTRTGAYRSTELELPSPGRWTLNVLARVGDFDEYRCDCRFWVCHCHVRW